MSLYEMPTVVGCSYNHTTGAHPMLPLAHNSLRLLLNKYDNMGEHPLQVARADQ